MILKLRMYYARKEKWNFTKFLIDREGNVVERFESTDDMEQVEQKIAELL